MKKKTITDFSEIENYIDFDEYNDRITALQRWGDGMAFVEARAVIEAEIVAEFNALSPEEQEAFLTD